MWHGQNLAVTVRLADDHNATERTGGRPRPKGTQAPNGCSFICGRRENDVPTKQG